MTVKQDALLQAHLAVDRAVGELRRQQTIVVYDAFYEYAVFPFEFVNAKQLKAWQAGSGVLRLLLTSERMRSMGLGFTYDMALVDIEKFSLGKLQSQANPLLNKRYHTSYSATGASEAEQLALKLAKYAGLLPAMLCLRRKRGKKNISFSDLTPEPQLRINAEDIRAFIKKPLIDIMPLISAKLPIEGMENTRITSFSVRYGSGEHLALVIGDISAAKNPKGVLTRVHSSCVTGDILGSMRCDCGDQLHVSIEKLKKAGSGILVYLQQEGRGIGITNKLRAYALQEQGVDTYDANLMLGFSEDERDFSIAAAILKKLGVTRIRLLSNNPQKIAGIEKHGITIAERVPLVVKKGKHNHAYLDAKAKKSGHML